MDRLTNIILKPSCIALCLHAAVLCLSLIALWLCGLSWWLKLFLSILLLCTGILQHKKQKCLFVSAIGLEQEKWWALLQNRKVRIELVNEQLVLPWLVVLNWREAGTGKKYALVLWPDMAHADDLRRLRVQLRNG